MTRPAVTRKAVQWQENYPAVQPRADEGYPEVTEEMEDWQRVQKQGFVTKAPPSIRDKSGNCPECHGPNYFHRKWGGKECAPLCTDCGYNGDYFTQSGTLLNSVGAHSEGPTQFARSDNPNGNSSFQYDSALESQGWNPALVTR